MRSGLPLPVRLMGVGLHPVRPAKLCCPLRIISKSGYVNGKGLSEGRPSDSGTTSFGLASPGIGFSNVALIQLKIVVFAPIPSASVRITIAANPGAFAITRRLYRTSCQNEFTNTPPRDLLECPNDFGSISAPEEVLPAA